MCNNSQHGIGSLLVNQTIPMSDIWKLKFVPKPFIVSPEGLVQINNFHFLLIDFTNYVRMMPGRV